MRTAPLAELELLPPIEAPEIWCAGVTYERSRDARLEEAQTDARDVYALVYAADRPEVFLKDAGMRRTVGPDGLIRTRSRRELDRARARARRRARRRRRAGRRDGRQRRLEPRHRGREPALHPAGEDLRGRAARSARRSPCRADWDEPWTIRLRIADADGRELFAGETSTAKMRRTPHELAGWVVRDNPVPAGSVLLTGTGLVPPDDYTLEPGHVVSVTIDGIGTLVNTVGG